MADTQGNSCAEKGSCRRTRSRASRWLDKVANLSAQKSPGAFVSECKTALMHWGDTNKVVRISPEDWNGGAGWFVLGDIHGDFYALLNILLYIIRNARDFRLVFLGDLVDRGPHQIACIHLLLAVARRHPKRILWLAGNHDIGVNQSSDGLFASTVFPAEFIDLLNEVDGESPKRRDLGVAYIDLASNLPRAALAPDGSLFVHGGIPLVDLQARVASLTTLREKVDWLNSDECLQDFTWTRITRYRRKFPNRISTGCSYGYEDFAAFCGVTHDFFPASRLVTGHEHPRGGADLHKEWKDNPALTLKGFGFDNHYDRPEAFNALYEQSLVIGRCRNGELPEVVALPVDRVDLALFYDEKIAPRFCESSAVIDKLI